MEQEVLRKVQKLELYVLKEVTSICDRNNIPYIIVAGTLLGAIRHKGFIPWDDDIDIALFRPDFDRFIEVCKKDLDTEKWFLQVPETESNSADYGIARLRLNNTHLVIESRKKVECHDGFFIDIFPYDRMPDNKLKAFIYGNGFAVLKRVYAIRKGYISNPRTLYAKLAVRTATFLFKPIKTTTLEKWLKKYPYKYLNKNTKQVSILNEGYAHEHHDFNLINERSTATFEGCTFSIPKDYDSFLRNEFGDYMQLPPPDQQVNHHKIINIDFGPYEDLVK